MTLMIFRCIEVSHGDRLHDVTDLYLAPVLLSADARIEELGKLDKDGLAYEVALESDSPDFLEYLGDSPR